MSDDRIAEELEWVQLDLDKWNGDVYFGIYQLADESAHRPIRVPWQSAILPVGRGKVVYVKGR